MINNRWIPAAVACATLAGCGGTSGGSGDGNENFSFELSTGILTDVEVPAGDSLDQLPNEVARVVNGFREFNEADDPSTSFPVGDATYDGDFAFGFEGDNDALVAGRIFMTVNFQTSSVDGSLNNITVYDEDGFQLEPNAGLLELSGGTQDNRMNFDATGNVEVEGDTYTVAASLAGAFGGNDADYGLGQISGTVTNPDTSTDQIDGLYTVGRIAN